MKIMMVGPLPKDVGGSYTTGVCKVIYELSKQEVAGMKYYISASNISDKKAKKISAYPFQYNGYRLLFGSLVSDFLFHPVRTWKEMRYYKDVLHANPLKWEFYKVNIKDDIRRVKPDIIHVHQSVSAAFFANPKHIPSIVTMHGTFYHGEEGQDALKGPTLSYVQHADFYTGLTAECEYYMKNLYGIPSEKMTIIPNGTNTDVYYYDSAQRELLRREYGANDGVKVFITVASIQERKGQLRFIKLLEILGIDYQYWILGDGPDRQIVENYVNAHGLDERVRLFGSIESKELYKYYSAADIYAHPSTLEGQALCEMEAYATGIRTIVSKDVRDTVMTGVDNIDIYYIHDFAHPQYDDLKQWVNKGNPNRKSRKDADWRQIAEMYYDFYRTILNNNSSYGTRK